MFSFDYGNLFINNSYPLFGSTNIFAPYSNYYFPSIFNMPSLGSYIYSYPYFGMSFGTNTTFQDIFMNSYFSPYSYTQPYFPSNTPNIFNASSAINESFEIYNKVFGSYTSSNTSGNSDLRSTSNTSSSTNINNNTKDYEKKSQNFKLDQNFINKVKDISNKLNCNYKDLLAVMNSESGINPQAWNGKVAVGLIQFTDIALKDINKNYGTSYTKQDVAKMSGIEQLDLVEKFLTMVKKRNFPANKKLSAGDLYAMVFAPSIADQEVFYRKGSKAYAQNPLDLDNDGAITKTDLERHLAKKQVNLVA